MPETLRLPDGHRVFAIGDIHGMERPLSVLLDHVEAMALSGDGMAYTCVLLGDYIDRGPDSRGVLERLLRLRPGPVRWVFLAGNHEAVFQAFLDRPEANADWLRFGGIETLASYGIMVPPPPLSPARLRRCRDELLAVLPASHLDFLAGLQSCFTIGDYMFVHAGLRPGVALERQTTEDMLWIREDFLSRPTWHGKCVVHGHTIEPTPSVHPWRIGIDLGAYAGGNLCCLVLSGEGIGFVLGNHPAALQDHPMIGLADDGRSMGDGDDGHPIAKSR
ncbi:MAG: metallophosphoesterase [Alphaproteobacteria bacterium]|nr:metallophosphoesterase [Alphaproteobacteria bacterium]